MMAAMLELMDLDVEIFIFFKFFKELNNFIYISFTWSSFRQENQAAAKLVTAWFSFGLFGSGTQDWTGDLMIMNHAL